MLKLWFPAFYTEAHRMPGGAAELVRLLAERDIVCVPDYSTDCDAIFCGSFFVFQAVKAVRKTQRHTPIIHYNWDLYPFQLGEPKWLEYLDELSAPQCIDIWVPSECTVRRTDEYTGRDATVIKTSVRPFDAEVWDGGYVLDVMRKYPDANRDLAKQACDELGINCIESRNSLPWEEFKHTIAGARILISAQYEASTGGLSLLEGYYLGKTSLISNSPYHGGIDHFGSRAQYFRWDSKEDLKNRLRYLFDNPPVLHVPECQDWIKQEYSEEAFANRIANRLRDIL